MGTRERDAPEDRVAKVEYLEPVGDDGEVVGWRPSSASSSARVVAGDRRSSRRYLGALVVVLLAGGLAVTWIGRDADRGGEGAGAADPAGAADDELGADEMEVTDVADVSAAYARAVARLGRARTFAYRGTVLSEEANIMRPGPRIPDEVTVEGAVHIPLSITTEVAVASNGEVVETVTSGAGVWARRAEDAAGLASAEWRDVAEPEPVSVPGQRAGGLPPSRLGVASVVDAVQVAGDRRNAPRDDEGRHVILATVPEHRSGRGILGTDVVGAFGGAELALTLDHDGDIARVELTAASGDPTLDLALDIMRLGDPTLVTPQDLADPVASSVPAGALEEVGLGSLVMPGLPGTWVLTGASSVRVLDLAPGAPPGCDGSMLYFTYNDLAGVAEGQLSLTAWHACAGTWPGVGAGVAPRDEVDVSAGRFSGSAVSSVGNLYGEVGDGATAIWFTTDLPLEEAAAALASLEPADGGPAG